MTNQSYGPLKAECDRIVRGIYQEDCTIVRPTYIVGPGDSYHFDNTVSMQAGLEYRSLVDSAQATLRWWQAAPVEHRSTPRGWLSPEAERTIIQKLS